MTPLWVSPLATEAWSVNSTKANLVGWVSSPAIRTYLTSPTCWKKVNSWSARTVAESKLPTYMVLLISSTLEGSTLLSGGG